MSAITDAMLIAFYKGFRVLPDGTVLSPRGNIKKLRLSGTGYLLFSVKVGGKSFSVRVHRLLAYQKYGEKLLIPGVVVRHKNNIKTDNHEENVLIGSPYDNSMDCLKDHRVARCANSVKIRRKLTDDQAMDIRNSTDTCISLAKKHNCSVMTVSRVRRGVLYTPTNGPVKKIRSHLTAAQIKEIKTVHMSVLRTSKKFGVSPFTVGCIRKGVVDPA